jgi:hypothetical protein
MTTDFDPYYKWLGIPPKDQPPHHYRLLGIELFEKDREVIDAAANRLMGYLKDLAVGDEGAYSQQLLNEIARARLCLLNKKEKTAYDGKLREKLKSEGLLEREARKPPAKGPPPKAPKRSVPPPAVPPSGAMPPVTAELPSSPKPPGSTPLPFDPAALAALDQPPKKSVVVDPVKIVVETENKKKGVEPAIAPDVPVQPRPKGHEETRRQQPIDANVARDFPAEPQSKGRRTQRQRPADPGAVKDVPSQPHPKSRGVVVAFVMISFVGLVGLTLIVVMSYLLLTG